MCCSCGRFTRAETREGLRGRVVTSLLPHPSKRRAARFGQSHQCPGRMWWKWTKRAVSAGPKLLRSRAGRDAVQKLDGSDQLNKLEEVGTWLRRRLPDLLVESQVPGAAVAVQAGDEWVESAAGVLSTATGVDATVDSLFQIGSITKVMTATLVMQLADEGRLDLDAPVRAVLPEFRIADEEAARGITTRHLLSHVAGFEGDIFADTGKGDDCLEKYLGVLRDVPQLFEPGAMFSYNNAGYCVLGRIVEVLREEPFDVCARRHLFTPLGMSHTASDPYEAIVHRTAVGHIETVPGAPLEPTPVWALARSNAPAGSMLAMRARDLLAFAQMHLAGGRGPDGVTVLGPETVQAMQRPQVTLPDIDQGAAWGSAGSSSTCRAARSSDTTGTPSVSRRSCAWCRSGMSRWRSSPTAACHGACTRRSRAGSSVNSPGSVCPPRRCRTWALPLRRRPGTSVRTRPAPPRPR